MSAPTFDLDVDVVPLTSARDEAPAGPEDARRLDEACSCTPGTINTYTVGVFDCPTCC